MEKKLKAEKHFIPGIWPWEGIPSELLRDAMSNIRYKMFTTSLIDETKRFIEESFPRSNITVEHEISEKTVSPGNATCIGSANEALEFDNNDAKFSFGVLISDRLWVKFLIRHIPALVNSNHITLFFRVLRDEIGEFSRGILSIQGAGRRESIPFEKKRECCNFFLNLRRVVTLKYLFHSLDFPSYGNNVLKSKTPWLPLKTVQNAFDFCTGLLTQNIEGRQVKTGFAFHSSQRILKKNAMSLLKLDRPVEFGDFDKAKALIEMADGEETWLNIFDDQITHIFASKIALSKCRNLSDTQKKGFYGNTIFVNINTAREVCFFHVANDSRRLLLKIRNGKTILQDESYVKERLSREFQIQGLTNEDSSALSAWFLHKSIRSHGTTVFLLGDASVTQQSFLKSIPISMLSPVLGKKKFRNSLLELLDRLSQTDGALFIDRNLIPKFAGVILPMAQDEKENAGGARHNSARSFSKNHSCFGLVVSHDGPITIFRNGDTVCVL